MAAAVGYLRDMSTIAETEKNATPKQAGGGEPESSGRQLRKPKAKSAPDKAAEAAAGKQ